jgi:arylsulfatase A-like enzyme
MKNEISRREFLKRTAQTGLGLGAASLLEPVRLLHAARRTRPNLLIIMTDQQRFDAVSRVQNELSRYDGKTKIRTPNLDAFSHQGAYFRNAYTQCAVCAPMRSSFRTGCTVERSGVQTNDLVRNNVIDRMAMFRDKIDACVTFEDILVSRFGYKAEYYGKWHMPDRFNYTQGGSARIIQNNTYSFTADAFSYTTPGLDYRASLREFQDQLDPNCSPINALYPNAPKRHQQVNSFSRYPYDPIPIDTRIDEPMNSTAYQSQPDLQGRDALGENFTPSHFQATAALKALERLGRGDDPFVLTCSFHNPHAPMIATAKYFDYYWARRDDMFVPPSIDTAHLENNAYGKHRDPDYQDVARVKEWMVPYYALCEEVDTYFGMFMAKLDALNLTDRTMVIFVSDHGEMLGAHGMREKNIFLEESAHVPLMMRLPGKIPARTVVDEPVSTMDVFATILDYLNAGTFDNSDGKSLRPFIEDTRYNRDYDEEALVTEWDYRAPQENGTLQRLFGGETNFLSLKLPWKLMLTKNASSARLDMLFNLETDPYEMNNLVGINGDSAGDGIIGKAEHLKALLIEWMQWMDGPKKLYSDPAYNLEGAGDITEIKTRRKWRRLDIWVSDTSIRVGKPVHDGTRYIRNEYLYLGRTTAGVLTVDSIRLEGSDALHFALSGFTGGQIASGDYEKVKISFLPGVATHNIADARMVIKHDAGADKIVTLNNRQSPRR